MSLEQTRHYFDLQEGVPLLKSTISICSVCLCQTPAVVYTDKKSVFIRKNCSVHGMEDCVLENDLNYYFLSNKDRCGVLAEREGSTIGSILHFP